MIKASSVRTGRAKDGMLWFSAEDVAKVVNDWMLDYSERAKRAAQELNDSAEHVSAKEGGAMLANTSEAIGAAQALLLLAQYFAELVHAYMRDDMGILALDADNVVKMIQRLSFEYLELSERAADDTENVLQAQGATAALLLLSQNFEGLTRGVDGKS